MTAPAPESTRFRPRVEAPGLDLRLAAARLRGGRPVRRDRGPPGRRGGRRRDAGRALVCRPTRRKTKRSVKEVCGRCVCWPGLTSAPISGGEPVDCRDERTASAPRLEVRARCRRGPVHRQPAVLPALDRAGQSPAAQAARLPHHRLPSRVPDRRARPATALAAAFPLLDAFSASPSPPIRGPRRGPAAKAPRDRHSGRADRAAQGRGSGGDHRRDRTARAAGAAARQGRAALLGQLRRGARRCDLHRGLRAASCARCARWRADRRSSSG